MMAALRGAFASIEALPYFKSIAEFIDSAAPLWGSAVLLPHTLQLTSLLASALPAAAAAGKYSSALDGINEDHSRGHC